MPFPILTDQRTNEPESDFAISDPFGLRRAVTPVFAFDLQDGMLSAPYTGLSIGLGTSFYVTPFGHQLSAMHVATDFFNSQGTWLRPGPIKNLIEPSGTCIGIFQDPGLVYGARPAGKLLFVSDFVMFPVDRTKHPLAVTFSDEQLHHIEPSLDLTAWDVQGLGAQKTAFLPMRIGCKPSIAEGDRVMAVGYPEIKSWPRPGAQLVSFREQMRGSIGKVITIEKEWDQARKIWPTITVDVAWKPGMSGGPVFNENGEVVGIVSRGAEFGDDLGWGRALWLEALPYRQDIYGCIDPLNPGWIYGWGVCNAPHSLVDLFRTREAAEAFVTDHGPGLSVQYVRAATHDGRL